MRSASRVLSCAGVGGAILFTWAGVALAEGPPCAVPEDPQCSILPPDLCPDGLFLVFRSTLGSPCGCCPWCYPLPEFPNPGCQVDLGTGKATCPTVAVGKPPSDDVPCAASLPSCWVCAQVVDPLPVYPVGSTITMEAELIDSCDLNEAVHWSICTGADRVTVISTQPNGTLQLCVERPGAVTVLAYQTQGEWGPFAVEKRLIVGTCLGDLDGNGNVGASDIAILLGAFGAPGCGGAACCPSDLDGDNDVDAADLSMLLGEYGPC